MPAGHHTGGHVPSGRPAAVMAALAVTQTIGYGTLYYAFAVLLTPLARDLGVTTTAVTGAYTASILVGAVLAVPVGRWLDAHGGRILMTAGSAAGVLLLIGWSQITSLWQLYLVQVGIGIAAAASLYEAAFAVVIALTSPQSRAGALLAITVVAGFSSTVFLPLTGWLVDVHGWRTTLVILAAVQAVTVPLHAFVVRRPAEATRVRFGAAPGTAAVRAALTDRGFWLLAIGFTAHTAAISALTVHLVAALVSWGHRPAFAASIAGLLGVLSVAGRVLTTGLQRRYRTTTVTAGVFSIQALAALLLPFVGATVGGAIGAVIGFGLGFGVATIAKPVLLAQRYDTRRYATLAGILVVPMTLAKAAAPLAAAAAAAATRTYGVVMIAAAVCCAVAAIALAAGAHDEQMNTSGTALLPT
ncbi:MFS transporter [Spirilliplanes yamanashiensis]|uniref:MFS transporter n=1 Tax=Spirilliplanes yamanashiensis TaxID=42233 RepID=A0A8J3YD99_9ACTN|nr:MFS transporter [Spirilliplanes yamanashiensis]MDP9818385.1 putative MFS family arabinose efflux permease [Spirilliplanes yamanashiensis]GIJ06606.1 MFS transporter [Spirilliplanes yamanashiensis]